MKSRNAVITGSTSGIGLAYAKALAGAGVNVTINGFGKPEDIEKERAALEHDAIKRNLLIVESCSIFKSLQRVAKTGSQFSQRASRA